MPLDLSGTAAQIAGMSVELKARQSDRQQRLRRAMAVIRDFPVGEYAHARELEEDGSAWAAPRVLGAPDSRYPAPPAPADFTVAAADGSHVDVDRHLPARCYLINAGVSVLTYGLTPGAELWSRPRLYAKDEELVIRDPGTFREQPVEGAVLGAKRAVEEIRALVEVVRGIPAGVPTLALLDGPLLVFGLDGRNQDFVLRELVEEGFAEALDELREMAKDRPLAVAGYTSLPGSAEVVGALRVMACEYGAADAEYRCGMRGPGRRPCGSCVGGLMDREVFGALLEPGERSGLFGGAARNIDQYYRGNDILFFYLHAGPEIGRVEVPSWVADDEAALALAHSLVMDQCRRGRGYPVALMEAHEQAAVTGPDRRYFVELVEAALRGEGLPVYTSEKARSKRLRWL